MCASFQKILNFRWSIPLIHRLISHKLQKLGRPNFLCYFTLNLAHFCKVWFLNYKCCAKCSRLEEKAKFDLNSWVEKVTQGLEMLKVRKKAKFENKNKNCKSYLFTKVLIIFVIHQFAISLKRFWRENS